MFIPFCRESDRFSLLRSSARPASSAALALLQPLAQPPRYVSTPVRMKPARWLPRSLARQVRPPLQVTARPAPAPPCGRTPAAPVGADQHDDPIDGHRHAGQRLHGQHHDHRPHEGVHPLPQLDQIEMHACFLLLCLTGGTFSSLGSNALGLEHEAPPEGIGHRGAVGQMGRLEDLGPGATKDEVVGHQRVGAQHGHVVTRPRSSIIMRTSISMVAAAAVQGLGDLRGATAIDEAGLGHGLGLLRGAAAPPSRRRRR